MKPTLLISRRETFSAAHRLSNPALSDQRNLETYGKCANPAGHGHNYVLEVCLSGEINPESGFLYDLTALSRVIHEEIIADVDHRNLNTDVEWLDDCVPTTEVLVSRFWERLEAALPSGLLFSVRVQETESNWAECRRPPPAATSG